MKIPPLVVKERIEEIARATGEPIDCIVEDGVPYLAQTISVRVRLPMGLDVQVEEIKAKVCPVDSRNTIAEILKRTRVDRRERDKQRREIKEAQERRDAAIRARVDEALDAMTEDFRTAAAGRIITSG